MGSFNVLKRNCILTNLVRVLRHVGIDEHPLSLCYVPLLKEYDRAVQSDVYLFPQAIGKWEWGGEKVDILCAETDIYFLLFSEGMVLVAKETLIECMQGLINMHEVLSSVRAVFTPKSSNTNYAMTSTYSFESTCYWIPSAANHQETDPPPPPPIFYEKQNPLWAGCTY